MEVKWLYALAGLGFAVALGGAFVFGQQPQPQPPVFNPAANPYSDGIHANGVIESFQADGANVNIYPEVSGPITWILVAEGGSSAPARRSSPSTIPCNAPLSNNWRRKWRPLMLCSMSLRRSLGLKP